MPNVEVKQYYIPDILKFLIKMSHVFYVYAKIRHQRLTLRKMVLSWENFNFFNS